MKTIVLIIMGASLLSAICLCIGLCAYSLLYTYWVCINKPVHHSESEWIRDLELVNDTLSTDSETDAESSDVDS
jgi:hypothetical protein